MYNQTARSGHYPRDLEPVENFSIPPLLPFHWVVPGTNGRAMEADLRGRLQVCEVGSNGIGPIAHVGVLWGPKPQVPSRSFPRVPGSTRGTYCLYHFLQVNRRVLHHHYVASNINLEAGAISRPVDLRKGTARKLPFRLSVPNVTKKHIKFM